MNTKSKLKAISIGIAAIIMMVSLFAAMAVSASPGVDVTDCGVGDGNKVYFTIYSNAKADGYARLDVNGAYRERKKSCCELPCEPEPTHLPDLVVENVVIQAFDQNPAGYPTTEWVMLYNPTNESVNISGWSISSLKYRGGRSFTIIENISIAARNYLTFVPGKQWLHDEDESVILKDAAGNIVDKIVNASDGDADNRYWERFDSDWQFGLQTIDTGGLRRGTVKYVHDGDTIHISPVCANATGFITYNSTDDAKIYSSPVAMAGIQSVRLDGIDAPELGTEEGNISMNFLDELCSGREVVFDIDDGSQYDKYDRVLAMVFFANGTNVNQEMLRNGSAIPLIIPPSEFVPYAISYEWNFGDGTNGTSD